MKKVFLVLILPIFWFGETHARSCRTDSNQFLRKFGHSRQLIASSNVAERTIVRRSSTFGTWVERRMHRNGDATILEITPSRTIKTTYRSSANCRTSVETFQRDLSPLQNRKYFTDADLRSLLFEEKRAQLIYVVSSQMPFSVEGIRGARQFAREINAKLTVLEGPASDQSTILRQLNEMNIGVRLKKLASYELILRGALDHYPSMFLASVVKSPDPARELSNAIQGYKSLNWLRNHLDLFFSRSSKWSVVKSGVKIASQQTPLVETNRRFIPVSRRNGEPFKEITGFNRPIAGTSYVPFSGNWKSWNGAPDATYLLNVDDESIVEAPCSVDLVGTPDGRYILSLNRIKTLSIRSLDEVLRRGCRAWELKVFNADVYPSSGLLEEGNDYSIYRVLSNEGHMRATDLHIDHNTNIRVRPEITVLKGKRRICPNKVISLPFVSRDGNYFGGIVKGESIQMLRILDDDTCEVVHDTGFSAGKVDISPNGHLLTFHQYVPDFETEGKIQDTQAMGKNVIAIYDIRDRSVRHIEETPRNKYRYPGFKSDEQILVYVSDGDNGMGVELINFVDQ